MAGKWGANLLVWIIFVFLKSSSIFTGLCLFSVSYKYSKKYSSAIGTGYFYVKFIFTITLGNSISKQISKTMTSTRIFIYRYFCKHKLNAINTYAFIQAELICPINIEVGEANLNTKQQKTNITPVLITINVFTSKINVLNHVNVNALNKQKIITKSKCNTDDKYM